MHFVRLRRVLRCATLFALSTVLGTTLAFAQLDRGQISGRVKDAQGGVVPGVTVTAINQQTQLSWNTVTDATGFYTFPNLPAGKYNVDAELQGFKKALRENVQLDAAGSLTLDFGLETGALSESVTVTAESPRLQSDVALRKTIESKDIEQLSFNGRNPIGVVGLKPGVIGGSFNNYGFSNLGNGGFNINGSRADENNISVDGATAIRTRSSGAIVGIQNVDAIQEVQVLTGDYMPEYGRASGGQIRMVTKSGGNRFTGSGSFFYRDDKLQANTWTRNHSSNLDDRNTAPFNYKQYGYSAGGPILKDKLFFFAAQEWVNYLATQTNLATVPTAKMRTGDFSELLDPNNGFYGGAQVIIDPTTRLPFPGNVIPGNMLSANGLALLRAYPLPTPGFRQGSSNAILNSENPQDQRKDNIRIDYRMNPRNNFTFRYGKYNWTAVDAFRGTFPYARTDWDRPNTNQTLSWQSTLSNTLVNEVSYTHSLDEVYINVFKSDLYSRSKYGINYPYIFPANKEIEDKIPTISINNLSEIDGGPYPSSSTGPIHTFTDTATWVKNRHTFKGGVVIEYSGENDFDQINVQPIPGSTNNQNGRFEFTNGRTDGTGVAMANAAIGRFTNYAEIGQRAFTKWRSTATDLFFQDSWKPTSNLTVEGGVRYVIWPPWYSTTNNIASFNPAYYDPSKAATIDPATGRITSNPKPFNGVILPGSGFPSSASDLAVYNDPTVTALFVGAPRGLAETHKNVFEPRIGTSYQWNDKTIFKVSGGIFHNRVTLNDSMLLGGNPPFQPQVSVSNGSADDPGLGGAAALPLGMTAIDPVFKHPTSYMWSAGVQRELPWAFTLDAAYVGRRGRYLQRERNINQLLPGTVQANPGVNSAYLRPYKGYGVIRLSENAGRSEYEGLQIGLERRYQKGFKFGLAYTLGHSQDNASDKRNVLFNSYDDTGFWGNSSFDRRHVFNFYYIYDLPFFQQDRTSLQGRIFGGWQISGATFLRTGTPLWITRGNDIAGVGDTFGQPYNLVGNIFEGTNGQLSESSTDQNFYFNPKAFAAPAQGTFGNAPRNSFYGPGEQQWDIALFKNVTVRGSQSVQFRAEIFNFPNHPNLNGPNTDPTSSNFGKITSKDGNRRDIQLSLRYLF